MGKVCIKCHYERQPTDTTPDYECPKCQVIYAKAEKAMLGRTFTPAQQQETKRCPYCGESVLAIALKCKHCSSDLTKNTSQQGKKKLDVGALLLLFPFVMSIIIWQWVGSMMLIQNPTHTLTILGVFVVFVSASLVAWEVNQSNRTVDGLGALGWFLMVLLFWIISYPMYMLRRSKIGLKNLLIGSVVVALVFVGVLGGMYKSIDDGEKKIRMLQQQAILEANQAARKMAEEYERQSIEADERARELARELERLR